MAESRVEMLLNEDVMRNEAKSRRTTESLGLRTRKIRRRISWEEIDDRWFKGLCMFCDEQETLDHHLNHKNAGMLFLDDGEVQLVLDEEAVEIEDERSCDMFLVDENEKSSATSCELEQRTEIQSIAVNLALSSEKEKERLTDVELIEVESIHETRAEQTESIPSVNQTATVENEISIFLLEPSHRIEEWKFVLLNSHDSQSHVDSSLNELHKGLRVDAWIASNVEQVYILDVEVGKELIQNSVVAGVDVALVDKLFLRVCSNRKQMRYPKNWTFKFKRKPFLWKHVGAEIKTVRGLSQRREGSEDMRMVTSSFVMKLSFRDTCVVLKEQRVEKLKLAEEKLAEEKTTKERVSVDGNSAKSNAQAGGKSNAQAGGKSIRGAENAMTLEKHRLKKLNELEAMNQSLKSRSSEDFSSFEKYIGRVLRQITGLKVNVSINSSAAHPSLITEFEGFRYESAIPKRASLADIAERIVDVVSLELDSRLNASELNESQYSSSTLIVSDFADIVLELEKAKKEMKMLENALQGAVRKTQAKIDEIMNLMHENEQIKSVTEGPKMNSNEAEVDSLREEYHQRVATHDHVLCDITQSQTFDPGIRLESHEFLRK